MKRLVDEPPLILVVEDDPDSLANTSLLLELEGFAVIGAKEGREGLGLIWERRPDVVICDILMPLMDGMALLAEVRQHPEIAGTPFLFLTALTDYRQLRQAMNAGADDYLTKPYTPADLLEAVTARLIRADQRHEPVEAHESPECMGALSHREREILDLIGQGFSSQQISDRLYISRRTVDTHRVHLLNKLGLANGRALVQFAALQSKEPTHT